MVWQGLTNKDIAGVLRTSEQVVKNYLRTTFDKLGVWTRLELALYVAGHGGANWHAQLGNGLLPAGAGWSIAAREEGIAWGCGNEGGCLERNQLEVAHAANRAQRCKADRREVARCEVALCVVAWRGFETGYARCEIGLGIAAGRVITLALALRGGPVRSIRAETSRVDL
ncbi:MAG: LuxR C-terminal-related transcriptional regulator [Terriglobales bacterium]